MNTLSRRQFLATTALAATAAHAADVYPARPIRMVLGFGAGGTTDAIARYYAQKLTEVLKVAVIVDNKPGAGQMLAIRTVMAAPPDGYTLYAGTASALSQGPGVRKDVAYDPLKDFTYVGLMASTPGVFVVAPNLPVRSMADLVRHANDSGGRLNYASSGIGSSSHLQTEYLLKVTGMQITHIPFKSDADIMRELTAGAVQLGMSSVQGAMSSIAAGRVRPIAVTGARRMKSLPAVPSLTELDYKGIEGIDPYSYYGVVGPVGLPPAIVSVLNDAINQVSRMPDVAAHVQEKLYSDAGLGSAESFRQYVQRDLAKWSAFSRYVKVTE